MFQSIGRSEIEYKMFVLIWNLFISFTFPSMHFEFTLKLMVSWVLKKYSVIFRKRKVFIWLSLSAYSKQVLKENISL